MNTLAKTIVGAAALATASFPAAAQQNCGKREDVVKQLEEGYKEQSMIMALSNRGHIVEIFGNEETGTFTVFLSRPDGISCLVDAGTGIAVGRKADGPTL